MMKSLNSWASVSVLAWVFLQACGQSEGAPSASDSDGGSAPAATGAGAASPDASEGGGASEFTGAAMPGTSSGGAPNAATDAAAAEACEPVYQAVWTPSDSGPSPAARLSHAMSGTPEGVVLFGGGTLLLGGLADTWIWSETGWQQLEPQTAPASRAGHGMAYSEVLGAVVLFGGDGGALLQDTWQLQDGEWTDLCPDESCGVVPQPRSALGLSEDPARGKIVLFGGFDGESPLGDTWEWDQEQGWQQICGGDCDTDEGACCGPAPRHGHQLVYDSSNERILMFGGTDDTSEMADLWAYDDDGWQELQATGPSARAGHAMGFDPDQGVVVLFGGSRAGVAVSDAVWGFDVRQEAWAPLQTEGASPEAREFAAMAFDPNSHQFVLFGGGESGQYQDTWLLSYQVVTGPQDCLGQGGMAGAAGAPTSPGQAGGPGAGGAPPDLGLAGGGAGALVEPSEPVPVEPAVEG